MLKQFAILKLILDNYSALEECVFVLRRRGLLRRKLFWVGDILKRVERVILFGTSLEMCENINEKRLFASEREENHGSIVSIVGGALLSQISCRRLSVTTERT